MDNHEAGQLNERIEKLEREVWELRRRLDYLTRSAAPESPRVSETVSAGIPTVRTPEPVSPPPRPIHPPSREFSPAKPPVEKSPPSRTREEWETLIGGKLLNRIGALALIIGMGFFLKYAFDNNWISETVRVLIGGGIGISLLAGAWHFRQRDLQIFAQGLLGAGIAILYLSVYASFNFYHLVPQAVAFVFMSAVTLTAFLHALRYDSFAVSLLGWFGGFLTPFLLSTGEANETGLFTYILLLDIGLAAILLKKPSWALLEFLTFAATWATYAFWFGSFYTADALATTLVFLTLFWGVFLVLDLAWSIRPVRTFIQLRHWVYSLNVGVFFLALFIVIYPNHSGWSAPVTLALGAVYFLTFIGVLRRPAEAGDAPARYALIAIALLVIATGIQFSDYVLVIVWALEGLALVWCGTYWRMSFVWMTGLGLSTLTTVALLGAPLFGGYQPENAFLLNSRALAFAVLAASLGAAVAPLRIFVEEQSRDIRTVLHYAWGAIMFVLCSVETYDSFLSRVPWFQQIMMTVGWMVYALPMVWAGVRFKTQPPLRCGLGAALLAVGFAIVIGFSIYDPIARFTVLMNSRAAEMLFLLAGAFILNHRLRHAEKSFLWISPMHRLLQLGIVLLAFSLITSETRDFFQKSMAMLPRDSGVDITAAVNRLENLQQLSLSALWLAYSLLLIGLGIWRRFPSLRIFAIVLFGFTILKIFIYDLSFLDTLYRIFSFVGLGVILLGVSYVYQRYKTVIFDRGLPET